MKLKQLLTSAFALVLATSAQADVEVLITGATAFRVAALDTIRARYSASGAAYQYAHDLGAGLFNGSTRSVFKGTFPGVTGVTTVRCTFNGSTEGIRAVALGGSFNPTFLTDANLITAAAVGGGETPSRTSPTAASQPKFTFSDARQSSSPVTSPALNPTDARVGVVVFTMIANEGAPAGLTNITSQQFKALFTVGNLPLSSFTGDAADAGSLVFATGRNDGSGTRTTYLAETGYGVAKPVQQYVTTNSSATEINVIQRVPAGGGAVPANASTLWGNDVDGNGGYSSGSALRTDMGKISPTADVLDANGDLLLDETPITLVTFLSNGDALPASVAGAKVLGYNGVTITPIATGTGLSPADKAKVTQGQYTAWSYQQFYHRGTLSADETAVRSGIVNNIAANLGTTGISLTDMAVSRADDGAPVAP